LEAEVAASGRADSLLDTANVMDELETTSLFSSIADAPMPLRKQYTALTDIFYQHKEELPDHNLPGPNSEAMARALEALQKRICDLESKNGVAAETFQHLSEETNVHGSYTQESAPSLSTSSSPVVTSNTNELKNHLSRIDARFSEQADELSDMKKRLDEAVAKQLGFSCSKRLKQQHKEQQKGIFRHMSRDDDSNDVSYCATKGKTTKIPQKRSKQKKAVHCTCEVRAGVAPVHHCKPVPGMHYRINWKDVPFLLTANTSPSHSITANYQQVLASMKCHSPLLCGAVAAKRKRKGKKDLMSLLNSLEEEFGRLTFEHQELAQQLGVQPTHPPRVEEEKRLQTLADQMKSKAEQICIVDRQIHKNVTLHKPATADSNHKGMMAVSPREANVKLLQGMKAIQATLQQDDLSWD
jgi:centrosomal protein CEP57